MNVVVDTHCLIWLLAGSPRLSPRAKAALTDPESRVMIPAIVLAEVAFLFERKRIGVDLTAVREFLDRFPQYRVIAIDETTIEYLPPHFNIHDGLIVATALMFRDRSDKDTVLVTKDKQIRESGIIEIIW